MVSSWAVYGMVLGLLGVQRLAELLYSARNARRLRAEGAVEVGARHYPWMVALHTAFLPCCAWEAWHRPVWIPLAVVAGAGLGLAQALRYWAIVSLGPRWTTRVLVLARGPAIRRGPYRFLRHPNYLAVALELALVPLLHGAWITAAAFSAGNAVLLWRRIQVEEAALGDEYQRAFSGVARLLPGGRAWRSSMSPT